MSLTQLLAETTYADPCDTVTLSQLRRRYRDETGEAIPRTTAIVQLAAAGVPVAANGRGQTVVLGRSWQRPLHWTVQGGKAVRVPA